MPTPSFFRIVLLTVFGAAGLLSACGSSGSAPLAAAGTGGHAGGSPEAGGSAGTGATAGASGTGAIAGTGGTQVDGGPDGATDGAKDADPNPDAETSFDGNSGGSDGGPATVLRIAAANLSSGNGQSYDPGEGIRIFQGLKPDVVLIQEFNYGANTEPAFRSFVDTAFGTTFAYYRESGAQIPNGVISRYPILQSGEWDDPNVSNRDLAWARIDLPGSADLWAVSVHFLTTSATERNQQAQSLISYMAAQIPNGDLVVLGGDFNVESRTEGCISTLSQRFTTASPWPADEAANGNTNHNRNKPYDWLVGSPSLHALEVPLVIGSKTFSHGLVFDSRVYSALSEIPPIQATDSDGPSMQHMAVLRAFAVP